MYSYHCGDIWSWLKCNNMPEKHKKQVQLGWAGISCDLFSDSLSDFAEVKFKTLLRSCSKRDVLGCHTSSCVFTLLQTITYNNNITNCTTDLIFQHTLKAQHHLYCINAMLTLRSTRTRFLVHRKVHNFMREPMAENGNVAPNFLVREKKVAIKVSVVKMRLRFRSWIKRSWLSTEVCDLLEPSVVLLCYVFVKVGDPRLAYTMVFVRDLLLSALRVNEKNKSHSQWRVYVFM